MGGCLLARPPGHTPRASLRSLAPLSPCERGVRHHHYTFLDSRLRGNDEGGRGNDGYRIWWFTLPLALSHQGRGNFNVVLRVLVRTSIRRGVGLVRR